MSSAHCVSVCVCAPKLLQNDDSLFIFAPSNLLSKCWRGIVNGAVLFLVVGACIFFLSYLCDFDLFPVPSAGRQRRVELWGKRGSSLSRESSVTNLQEK